MKRITISLPDELHDQLRQDAFRAKTSISALIRVKLQDSVALPRRHSVSQDPILTVAGVCRGPALSSEIDGSLYGR